MVAEGACEIMAENPALFKEEGLPKFVMMPVPPPN
jgi:hypothetical protein